MFRRSICEARGFGMEVDEPLSDCTRPWGAFIRIKESSFDAFARAYWDGIEIPNPTARMKLDPKILIVAPGKRLSLQYHHRRQEHWRVMDGPVKIVMGPDGSRLEEKTYQPGDVLRIPCGAWHRLVGCDCWGRIAEIWHHEDPTNPSDESDIERPQDDFGRKSPSA